MKSLESIAEQTQFAAHIDIVSRTIPPALALLRSFKIAPATTNKRLFTLITLNEIVRKCRSIEAMAHPDKWAGIVPVVRSVFESVADLRNLLTLGDEYASYMMWLSLNQQRTFFQGINSNTNSGYYAEIQAQLRSKYQNVESVLADTATQMQEITDELPERYKGARGKVKSGGMFRFQLAGLTDEYNVLYRRLSARSHGQVSDMLEGVLEGSGFRWPPGEDAPPLVAADTVAAMLIESCGRVACAYRRPIAPFERLKRLHFSLKRS